MLVVFITTFDYKLLSKTMANRLEGVMDCVIHPDQTYCVPGRSIFDNISLVRDVLEVSNMLDCGLISLDQEKAFDHVICGELFWLFVESIRGLWVLPKFY